MNQKDVEYERLTPLSQRLAIAADSNDDREARWSAQAKMLEDKLARALSLLREWRHSPAPVGGLREATEEFLASLK